MSLHTSVPLSVQPPAAFPAAVTAESRPASSLSPPAGPPRSPALCGGRSPTKSSPVGAPGGLPGADSRRRSARCVGSDGAGRALQVVGATAGRILKRSGGGAVKRWWFGGGGTAHVNWSRAEQAVRGPEAQTRPTGALMLETAPTRGVLQCTGRVHGRFSRPVTSYERCDVTPGGVVRSGVRRPAALA